jgi:type IV secretion system T-DNA border endonuclease VirD2
VAEALERASTILVSGGQIQSDGAIYMSQDETAFDTLITEFSQNIRQIEAAIDRAPASERPEIERKLTDVLVSVAHLNPLGDRSAALLDAPSPDGVYARANMREGQLGRFDDDAIKARLSEALQGTGIDPDAVAARMREGAGNAALERQWLAQDLRAIAKAGDLDLEKGEDREEALDRLEAVHVRLGDTLTDARILRAIDDVDETEDGEVALAARITLPERELEEGGPDVFAPSERQDFQQLVAQFRRTDFDHPFSDDPSVRRAGAVEVEEARAAFNAYAQRSPDHAELASMAWDKITDSRKPQEYAVEEKDRTLHAGDMDLALREPYDRLGPITEDIRILALYRTEMPEEEFGAAVQEEVNRLRAMGASRAFISERSLEIEDRARQDYAERRYLAEMTPAVADYLRRAEAGDPPPMSEAEQQRFVAQIDRSLTPDAVAGLRAGNAEVLDKFSQDPLRQLELAKAYLESSEVTAHGPAMERVLDALAEEQIESQRARHAAAHGEKGITHG